MSIMQHTSPFTQLRRSKKILIIVGLICGLIAGGVTLLFPLHYRADTQVLILSHARFGMDPYTVVKAGERIGENLSQVIRTEDFFERVKLQQNTHIDWSYFDTLSPREKRKTWERAISPSVVYGSSMLSIRAYHPDRAQAAALAGSVADTLVSAHMEYVGGDVSIRMVNSPIATSYPVRPNPLLNAVAAAFVGMLYAAMVIMRRR